MDDLLKMWKSLTPKSLYREDVNPSNLHSEKQVVIYWTHDFQKQIPVINLLCAISIRNRGWPALAGSACLGHAFCKCMHLGNASFESIRLTTSFLWCTVRTCMSGIWCAVSSTLLRREHVGGPPARIYAKCQKLTFLEFSLADF